MRLFPEEVSTRTFPEYVERIENAKAGVPPKTIIRGELEIVPYLARRLAEAPEELFFNIPTKTS